MTNKGDIVTSAFEIISRRRGWTPGFLDGIEDGSHGELVGTEDSIKLLHEAHEARARVCVLPDFDCDGVMSGTLGYVALSELGFDVGLFIPSPKRGYEVTLGDVDRLMSENPGCSLVITCDVGISARDAVSALRSRGVSVVVTDHHKEDADTVPSGCAIVDPARDIDPYAHPAICGAYVLWQVMRSYAAAFEPAKVAAIDELRVFAAIGTVSDMMPMLYENRVLVKDGLRTLGAVMDDPSCSRWARGTAPFVEAFGGLRRLLDRLRSDGKMRDGITEDLIGYYMAPMINSIKRVDGDMFDAFGTFLSPDHDGCIDALVLDNERRKSLVADAMALVDGTDQPLAPFVYVVDAPKGTLGLIATRLRNRSGLPCCVLDRSLSGSGRSPDWYPFLTRVRPTGVFCAGHEGAFGLGVGSMANAGRLRDHLAADTALVMSRMPERTSVSYDLLVGPASLGCDVAASGSGLLPVIADIEAMRPYGRGFEAPVIGLAFPYGDASWRRIGSDGQHLKATLPGGFDALFWNQADTFLAGTPDIVGAYGSLSVNSFRGSDAAQFMGDIVSSEQ